MAIPFDSKAQRGPIATKSEYDKILAYIDFGKQSGAKLTAGSGTKKINGKGLFIEATVFANATNDLKISREEIFGPVVPVIAFKDEDEAVRIANNTTYGLTSGILTGDLRHSLFAKVLKGRSPFPRFRPEGLPRPIPAG